MSAIGSFLGPSGCFSSIAAAFFRGGVISLALMLRSRSLESRFVYFMEYINHYSKEMKWKPYLEDTPQEAKFCFSVPIFLSVLCYVGGLI